MAQPKTTGEAIQIIRRALYDLAHQPGWTKKGVRQTDILNYCMQKGWPVPVSVFDKAISQLRKAGAVGAAHPWAVVGDPMADTVETRYWLTASGDLEEEAKRRQWAFKVLDEVRRPRTSVEFALAVFGFLLGLLSGLVLGHRT